MTYDEIQEVLGMVGLQGSVRSGNIVLRCPFAAVSGHKNSRDSHPSLGIKTDEDGVVWNCFACGRAGPIRYFFESLADQLGLDVNAALSRVDALLELDPEAIAESLPAWGGFFNSEDESSYPIFSDNWAKPFIGKVPKYILDRGIELDTARVWELGYDKPRLRAFFPVRDRQRNLVGAVGGLTRKIDRQAKYMNYWANLHSRCKMPVTSKSGTFFCAHCSGRAIAEKDLIPGFKKSHFLYGEHLFTKGKTAVIVEGMIDTPRVWQALKGTEFQPLGTFGSKISYDQVNKIVQLTNGSLIDFFDNDEAGRSGTFGTERRKGLLQMIGPRVRYRRVDYNSEDESLDPGKLDDAEIVRMVKDAEPLFA